MNIVFTCIGIFALLANAGGGEPAVVIPQAVRKATPPPVIATEEPTNACLEAGVDCVTDGECCGGEMCTQGMCGGPTIDQPGWKLEFAKSYCSGTKGVDRMDLPDSSSPGACAVQAMAEPKCGNEIYTKIGETECRCVMKGKKCQRKTNSDRAVFVLTNPCVEKGEECTEHGDCCGGDMCSQGVCGGPSIDLEGWELQFANSYCSGTKGEDRMDLPDAATPAKCAEQAEANSECGDQIYTKIGETECRCVMKGKKCIRKTNTDRAVFVKKADAPEGCETFDSCTTCLTDYDCMWYKDTNKCTTPREVKNNDYSQYADVEVSSSTACPSVSEQVYMVYPQSRHTSTVVEAFALAGVLATVYGVYKVGKNMM